MADEITTPHLAYPFTLTADGAAVVEQDTPEEVFACVRAIVACPIGFRDDLPRFGIPDPLFKNAPLNTDAYESAITEWEPRARVDVTDTADASDPASRHLRIAVSTEE